MPLPVTRRVRRQKAETTRAQHGRALVVSLSLAAAMGHFTEKSLLATWLPFNEISTL
jgi:hypothetical protein